MRLAGTLRGMKTSRNILKNKSGFVLRRRGSDY